MPPMCTPEKRNVDCYDSPLPVNEDCANSLYFNPTQLPENQSTDNEFQSKVLNLLKQVPDLDKYFNVHKKIGEGTFSTVYLANLKGDPKKKDFAIKHIIPTSHPNRIMFELKCMKLIGGINNVAGVQLCLRNLDHVVFVMEYQRHEPFSNYVSKMDSAELACYMKNLLIALAQVHKFNIIHRDIKPSNFLYDRKTKNFLLVDFGLAQEVVKPKCEHNSLKIPEVGVKVAIKRKREAMSPISNILQPTKRIALQNERNIIQKHFELKITPQPLRMCQKENNYVYTTPNNTGLKHTKKCPPKNGEITTPIKKVVKSSDVYGGNVKSPVDDCGCYGKPKMCSKCIIRPKLNASRAGTPGYRPPEVLFKYPHQTTAVDIWATGIIMLSILSNCTNFFESPNDIIAIAELMTIFGFESIKKVAHSCGRYLICNEKKPKLNIRKICCILKNRNKIAKDSKSSRSCNKCIQQVQICVCEGTPLSKDIIDHFPTEAYNLLLRLLDLNPNTRITAEDALKHPYLRLV